MKRLLFAIPLLLVMIGSVSATIYTCDSCSSCQGYIGNSTSGDVVLLNQDIDMTAGLCLDFSSAGDTGITFDGGGHTINGQLNEGVAYVGDDFNSNSFTIRNFTATNFTGYLVAVESNSTVIEDITAYYDSNVGSSQSWFSISGSNNILRSLNIQSFYSDDEVVVIFNFPATNNTLIDSEINGNMLLTVTGLVSLVLTSQNVIMNTTINGNQSIAISINDADDNLIYNNIFNSSIPFMDLDPGSSNNNIWNITKTAGTNIVGGGYLAGNFWAYPNGTGFSQTCNDTDTDGICDSSLSLSTGNEDYLPLSDQYIAPTPETSAPIDSIPSPFNGVAAVAIAAGFILLMVGLYFESGIDMRFFITGTVGLIIVISVIGYLLTGS